MNNQQTPENKSDVLNKLNKPIRLSTLIPQKQAADKTSMNLYIKETDGNSLSVFIPSLILVIIAVGLFSKFAVIDRINALFELQREEKAVTEKYEAAKKELENYDQVRSDYRRYSGKYLDDGARSLVDRMEIIKIIERDIETIASVTALDIKGNSVSVSFTAPSLAAIKIMRTTLENDPYVTSVVLKTATGTSSEKEEYVSSGFTFTVRNPEG